MHRSREVRKAHNPRNSMHPPYFRAPFLGAGVCGDIGSFCVPPSGFGQKGMQIMKKSNSSNHVQESLASKLIQINENGTSHTTTMNELIRRRAAGEKFLKMKGKAVYVLTDADKYTAIMRPIWREDKQEKRSLECIHKGKPYCAGRDCDGCTSLEYATESLDRLAECGGSLPATEDAASKVCRDVLYRELAEAMRELDETDVKILRMTADGISERDIAATLGFKSKTSVVKRREKLLPRLQKRLQDFL